MKQRASGVLMHISSLPGPHGIGDMGPWARKFADLLSGAGQSVWQMLPLNPTEEGRGNSPYNSGSAFAGNPLLISLEDLKEEGLLTLEELDRAPGFPPDKTDYGLALEFKGAMIREAFRRFDAEAHPRYGAFVEDNAWWLEDYALFQTLTSRNPGKVWLDWPQPQRDRDPGALEEVRRDLAEEMNLYRFEQFVFQSQWRRLRSHCNQEGIRLVGDLPIYVDLNSADVWANPGMFKLNGERRPVAVSGVPPDYFSSTGQLWGNPVYDWPAHERDGFRWWLMRMERNLALFDYVRIDHFRGLVGYWEVPAWEPNAINGHWVPAPAYALFSKLRRRFSSLPVIAEDLGIITPDVREAMRYFDLMGMRLIIFAFGADDPGHPYLPHNLPEDCLAYTGTHDNNTIVGWFTREAGQEERERVYRYLGWTPPVEKLPLELVRMLMRSSAAWVITPLQDVLGLGEEARMNRPSEPRGNWTWRVEARHLTPEALEALGEMTRTYGRS